MERTTLLEGLEAQMALLKGLVAEIEAGPATDRLKRSYDQTIMDLEYQLRKLRHRNYFL